MTKNLKTVKATIIMGIILISIIASVTPATSQVNETSLVGLQSLVQIDWKDIAPIIPRSGQQTYPITVKYEVTKGWILANFLFPFHAGRQVDIKLEVVDKPTWCTANVLDSTLSTTIKLGSNQTELEGKISIALDANAPAYGGGYVKIRATVQKIGLIAGFEKEITLPFEPSYLPLIKAEPEGTNTKRIGPMDTAVFPIIIENLGNARTKVKIMVQDKPEDWLVAVDDSIIIDEAIGSTGTIYVTVRPPKGFGYHDDDARIVLSLEPVRAENPNEAGEPELVSVVVESRGFSFIGAEVILPIIIVIIVILFIVYWLIKRIRK